MSRPLLELTDVTKHYPLRRGTFRGAKGKVRAVDGVSFVAARGEAIGLVGESGSGKSTIGRLVLGLEKPTGGRVRFEGDDLAKLGSHDRKLFRRQVQVVFQDPYGSLNPRMTVGAALREVLHVHRIARGSAGDRKAAELLERVGLSPHDAGRYPHEFSGGQRQRIGIARALAVEPSFLVADEPVSALDVSIQAQILELFISLREEFGLGWLFISHDLAVIRNVADTLIVLYGGKIVEYGPASRVLGSPKHPYTEALLAAVPRAGSTSGTAVLSGESGISHHPSRGCPLHLRCPAADEECTLHAPPNVEIEPGHSVRCVRYR